jgi:hypothetical protein
VLTTSAVVVLLLSLDVPSGAITDGELDGNRHPFVGLMVAQSPTDEPLWRCSGTLLSARLFLTAGHCTTAPATHVEIWFDADVQSGIPKNGYPNQGEVGGTPFTHPRYDPKAFSRYDLGVVVLDERMPMPSYGRLPLLDSLDELKPGKSTIFTTVGYGVQQAFPSSSAWKDKGERIRMLATPHLVQINSGLTGDGSLVLSNDANTGGICFGDSGGPNFVGRTKVIGGVTSFALNGTCSGTGGVYRVDRKDDLNWLDRFSKYL